jgi:hypothetical protein
MIDYITTAEKETIALAEDPQLVVTAIDAAVLEVSPSAHYLPGILTKLLRVMSKLPEPVLDMIQQFKSPLPTPNVSLYRNKTL